MESMLNDERKGSSEYHTLCLIIHFQLSCSANMMVYELYNIGYGQPSYGMQIDSHGSLRLLAEIQRYQINA
jgi:hypothetical protein